MGLFNFFVQDIAIDLGTANTIIYYQDKVVVDQPSIVAKDIKSGNVVAIGRRAQQMHGKTHKNIETIRPLRDGVIADFESAEQMIKGMIKMINENKKSWFTPSHRMVICIPSGITDVEKRAVKDSAEHAGGKDVYLIHEPMAAAIGIGIDVEEPMGNMIVDIGGGTSEIAVIALGGIVTDTNIRIAGDEFTRDIEDYMRRQQTRDGYVEVNTPQVVDRKLWEASGHWEKYQEHMFIVEVDEDHAREKAVNALKPMNCPCHVQVYNQGLKSYRDLPLRMAEFGSCNRYEPSGALHGIMRVRGFTQDDAHIFCREDQIEYETKKFINFLSNVYEDLGFEKFAIKFSDRPEQRSGSDAVWDRAEAALKSATEAAGCEFELNPGEGAFYGPKLEFVLTDAIGRDWQCGTLQVDFVLPERLDANYIGEDGDKHRPVMLHRACLGSFERFIGILIENFAGKLPFWLAPRQVVVAAIVSDADEYCREVVDLLTRLGIRAELDLRNEKINYKVREHSLAKVPVILACGKREVENQTVSIRRLGETQTSVAPLDEIAQSLKAESAAPDLR